MKKKHLSILAIVLFLVVIIIIYYFTLPAPFIPFGNLWEPQVQENRTPSTSPPISPEQTEETPTTSGGGEGAEAGEVREGEGGSEAPSNYTPKVNYTLNIEAFPNQFNVRTNYSVNDIIFNIENVTPYSVEIESDTIACVLLTSDIPGGSIVWWELDGEVCEASLCLGFLGCNMLMDKPHTAILYYEGTKEE